MVFIACSSGFVPSCNVKSELSVVSRNLLSKALEILPRFVFLNDCKTRIQKCLFKHNERFIMLLAAEKKHPCNSSKRNASFPLNDFISISYFAPVMAFTNENKWFLQHCFPDKTPPFQSSARWWLLFNSPRCSDDSQEFQTRWKLRQRLKS